jgi:hypothetical protein
MAFAPDGLSCVVFQQGQMYSISLEISVPVRSQSAYWPGNSALWFITHQIVLGLAMCGRDSLTVFDLVGTRVLAQLAGPRHVASAAFQTTTGHLFIQENRELFEFDLLRVIGDPKAPTFPCGWMDASEFWRWPSPLRSDSGSDVGPAPLLHPVRQSAMPHFAHRLACIPGQDHQLLAATCQYVNEERQGIVSLWDISGSECGGWVWEIGSVRSLAVSHDGVVAAAGSKTGQIVVWDL